MPEQAPLRRGRWRVKGETNSFDDSSAGVSDSEMIRGLRGATGSHPPMEIRMSKDDSDPSLMKKRTMKPRIFRMRTASKDGSTDGSCSVGLEGSKHRRLGGLRRKVKTMFGKRGGRSDDDSNDGVNGDFRGVDHFDSDDRSDFGRPSLHRTDSFGGSAHVRQRYNSVESFGGASLDGPRNVSFDLSSMQDGPSAHGDVKNSRLRERGPPRFDSMYTNSGGQRSFEVTSFATDSSHAPGERARYSVYHGSTSRPVKRKYRVRPYHCFPEAVNMTEEDIYKDSLLPSQNFEPLKSYMKPSSKTNKGLEVPERISKAWGSPQDDGRIGSFRVEVLGCISLPRAKPDVCVYIVSADTAFCTDVLTGYRSPMWPSVSKRAAIIPIHHAYAEVYVGVFDVRTRTNKDNDVFCGRVVIDISSLRPDTEYDITFPLRASTFIYDRKARGVIRLRFSLHWFNERAVVISYFKQPKSIVKRMPLVNGQPTIPCADPKTFRNLAITTQGQDLPGKYTRNAFRATMRELNLYQQNLRHLAKLLVLDAVMYEKPMISLYLFTAGMHCVIVNSVRLVPAYFVGYLLILLFENHQYYVTETYYNLGYRPLTIFEVAQGLILHHRPEEPNFESIMVTKQTKQRKGRGKTVQKSRQLSSLESNADNEAEEHEIVPQDHREFPFSERETYPKFAVENALAPSSKGSRRGSTTRLHGRLSVYYTSDPSMQLGGASGNEDDGDESSLDSNGDDETIMSESNMGDTDMFGLDDDEVDEDDLLELEASARSSRGVGNLSQSVEAVSKQRVRVGPPQNADTKSSKKIPPQVHLKKVENRLHKLSLGLSVELVHPPLSYDRPEIETSCDQDEDNLIASKKKKIPMDEFDKLLGLNSRSANPVSRIASSFLGPLMRMIRIFLYLVRISFNVSTWRDPYLTFWVFVALSVLCFILVVFPWRSFFLLVTVVCFGPQNVLIRKYLEKKAAKKQQKQLEELAAKESDGLGYEPDLGYHPPVETLCDDTKISLTAKDNLPSDSMSGMNFFQRKLAARRARRAEATKHDNDDDEVQVETRPAFCGPSNTSKKSQPRSIAVPYSRFKKDRFYDWPPDPTVSRATPLPNLWEDVAKPVDWENLSDDEDEFAIDCPDDVMIPQADDSSQEGQDLRYRKRSAPEIYM